MTYTAMGLNINAASFNKGLVFARLTVVLLYSKLFKKHGFFAYIKHLWIRMFFYTEIYFIFYYTAHEQCTTFYTGVANHVPVHVVLGALMQCLMQAAVYQPFVVHCNCGVDVKKRITNPYNLQHCILFVSYQWQVWGEYRWRSGCCSAGLAQRVGHFTWQFLLNSGSWPPVLNRYLTAHTLCISSPRTVLQGHVYARFMCCHYLGFLNQFDYINFVFVNLYKYQY